MVRLDGPKLYLKAMQRFSYQAHPDADRSSERKVHTEEYAYTLSEDPTLGVAMFSWEWNPNSETWPDPHLHIGRGDPRVLGYHKYHIPTGRVALEDVLKFAITELRVQTTTKPEDCIEILDDCLRRFHAARTR